MADYRRPEVVSSLFLCFCNASSGCLISNILHAFANYLGPDFKTWRIWMVALLVANQTHYFQRMVKAHIRCTHIYIQSVVCFLLKCACCSYNGRRVWIESKSHNKAQAGTVLWQGRMWWPHRIALLCRVYKPCVSLDDCKGLLGMESFWIIDFVLPVV